MSEHMAAAQAGTLVGSPRFYQQRPSTIEAVQLTDAADWPAIACWCGGRVVDVVAASGFEGYRAIEFPTGSPGVFSRARMTDWIVFGANGLFYRLGDEDFAEAYEPARTQR